MRIKIEESNKEKITEAIKKAEGKASARTISYSTICAVLEDVDKRFAVISKSARKGIKIRYTGAEQFPSAYKYTPDSTHFCAEYNGSAWVLTDVRRSECPDRLKAIEVTLTDAAREAIIKNFELF